jgi:hypothetical protein
MARRKEELDDYRKLMDDTLKEMEKLYNVKVGKLRPALAIAGVPIMAAGLTGVVYVVTADLWLKRTLTITSLAAIFAFFIVGVVGYILAHRGLKGTWL